MRESSSGPEADRRRRAHARNTQPSGASARSDSMRSFPSEGSANASWPAYRDLHALRPADNGRPRAPGPRSFQVASVSPAAAEPRPQQITCESFVLVPKYASSERSNTRRRASNESKAVGNVANLPDQERLTTIPCLSALRISFRVLWLKRFDQSSENPPRRSTRCTRCGILRLGNARAQAPPCERARLDDHPRPCARRPGVGGQQRIDVPVANNSGGDHSAESPIWRHGPFRAHPRQRSWRTHHRENEMPAFAGLVQATRVLEAASLASGVQPFRSVESTGFIAAREYGSPHFPRCRAQHLHECTCPRCLVTRPAKLQLRESAWRPWTVRRGSATAWR
jgi:hypothetical protein